MLATLRDNRIAGAL